MPEAKAAEQAAPGPKFGVLVTGKSAAALRRFIARYVKPAFGMRKNQWRKRYRERYGLTVLCTPLGAGQDAEAFYGRHADCGALVMACLDASLPASGRAATRAWLKARGFDPVVELDFDADAPESGLIDQGAEVVNFINARCPWRVDPIDDLEAYEAKNSRPFWM